MNDKDSSTGQSKQFGKFSTFCFSAKFAVFKAHRWQGKCWQNVFSEGCYSSQYEKFRLENIDCTLCFHRIIAQNSSFVAIPYTISHSVGNNHCTTDGNGMIPYKYSVDNQLGS